MTADLCRHDLAPARCVTCAGIDDLLEDSSRTFVARYDGTCAGCGFDVVAGQRIRYHDGRVVHEDC